MGRNRHYFEPPSPKSQATTKNIAKYSLITVLFGSPSSTRNSAVCHSKFFIPILVWTFPDRINHRHWLNSTPFTKTPEKPYTLAISEVFETGAIFPYLEWSDQNSEVKFEFLGQFYVKMKCFSQCRSTVRRLRSVIHKSCILAKSHERVLA